MNLFSQPKRAVGFSCLTKWFLGKIEGPHSRYLELTSKIAVCLFGFVDVIVIAPIVWYPLKEQTIPQWLSVAFWCVCTALFLVFSRIVRIHYFLLRFCSKG